MSPSPSLRTAALLLSWASAAGRPVSAQIDGGEPLGEVDFPVSCEQTVQGDFERGVALLHHMTYPDAHAVFAEVAAADPGCAMAYWGMAHTLFQPLWPTRPTTLDLEEGWRLSQAARSHLTGDQRERGFVEAVAAFFDPQGDPDYWRRIERWAEATARLRAAFPLDLETRAFYALSVLALAPRADAPGEEHARAAELLATMLLEEPAHPGAVHYTIHANDFDGRAGLALDVVRRYGEIAPRNPHALHMPTHIFVRLGEWGEVIEWNRRAAEAALAHRVGPEGARIWDEYPHAVEYLVYAHLQRADDAEAARWIEAIHATRALDPTFKTAFHLASTQARYALERRDWAAAARLEPRTPDYLDWDAFRWPEAVVWHARGVAAARTGDPAGATESAARIEALHDLALAAGEGPFAAQIGVLGLEVDAWSALAAGDSLRALRRLTEAVDLEERTPKPPVTPGATVPAREMLAELLGELGDAEGSLREYRASGARAPGRYNGILGRARAAAALGLTDEAGEAYRALLGLVAPGASRPGVAEARRYLEGMR